LLFKLGTIPGDSFADLDKSVSSMVTKSALIGSLEALHEVSLAHRANAAQKRKSIAAACSPEKRFAKAEVHLIGHAA